jgi:hypothetical protein
MGAAIATVVAYAFSACLLNVLHPRTRHILGLQARALLPIRHIVPFIAK